MNLRQIDKRMSEGVALGWLLERMSCEEKTLRPAKRKGIEDGGMGNCKDEITLFWKS